MGTDRQSLRRAAGITANPPLEGEGRRPEAARGGGVGWHRIRIILKRGHPLPAAARPTSPPPGGGVLSELAYAVGRGDEAVQDAGLARGVPGVVDEVERGPRPGLVQIPGGRRRRHDVVAALHDRARDRRQPMRVADELALVEKAAMHEVMGLDAREGEREGLLRMLRDDARVGQERDDGAFPAAPRLGGRELDISVRSREAAMVGGDQVAALVLGDRRDESLPWLGEQSRGAVPIEPAQLGAAHREDAAQHELADALRMRLGIGERQRRAPRAAEDEPALDGEHLPQPLDIGDEMPGGVGVERCVRGRAPAAALVEQEYPVASRVEKAAVIGDAAAARPAVQEHGRLAVRIAAQLPGEPVAVADIEVAAVIGLDRRIGPASGGAAASGLMPPPPSGRARRRPGRRAT